MTNKTSFDNIRAWLGEIKEYAQDDVVIMLLGKENNTATALLSKVGPPLHYLLKSFSEIQLSAHAFDILIFFCNYFIYELNTPIDHHQTYF